MSGLTAAQNEIFSTLIAGLDEARLARVADAVRPLAGQRAAEMQDLVQQRLRDRMRRRRVFGPLMPMFQPRRDGVEGLSFPPPVLERLWIAARSAEPELLIHLDGEEAEAAIVANRLALAASAAVRDEGETIWSGGDASAREDLAVCVDMLGPARRAVRALDDWLRRPDAAQVTAMRLLLRDSEDIHPDGPRHLTHILFAHMDDALLLLRVLVKSSSAAGLESSELALFVDRLMQAVQKRAARIASTDLSGTGGGAGEALERLVEDLDWCAGLMAEMDVTLSPTPDSRWGQGLRRMRQQIAGALSNVIRATEAAVEAGLPMARTTVAGRMTRRAPRLDALSRDDHARSTAALLKVVAGLRKTASVFGCEAERHRLIDGLTIRLIDYADEVLEMVHQGQAPDPAQALKSVKRVAEWLWIIEARDVARAMRRRVAAAGEVAPPVRASSSAS